MGTGAFRGLQGALLLLVGCGSAYSQVNVTTYHNDNSRSGQNVQETVLNPSNVNSTQFGKLFTTMVDGYVFAQPLYMSNVSIGNGVHDVVYAATEHDSVYAIDATSGAIYWQTNLIPAGGRAFNSETDVDVDCTDMVPEIGITGTPVIDAASNTLYVVSKSFVAGAAQQMLHALDLSTAAEKYGGPVIIRGSVPGSAYDSVSNVVTFNTTHENQRAGLLLENGHVVIAWASHCDTDPWHGWLMSYTANTLVQEAVMNTSANGQRSGIWMSGGGPAADANGNIYFATGNGTWNGRSDFGDSIVKLGSPAGGVFPLVDYFTPYNQGALADQDRDVASGGLVLLPTLGSGRQLLAQQSKQGTIYLIDRNSMGKYCVYEQPTCSTSDTQIVQEIMHSSGGLYGSPAYWNGNIYWTGVNEPIKAFSFNANNSGLISVKPTSETPQSFGFSAPTPSVSANGNTDGIVWALDGSSDESTCPYGSCLGLFAYDATDVKTLLYSSSQAANNRDSPGSAVKFETPIIANGKVYVGTQGAVSGFGLLSPSPPAPPPTGSAPMSVSLAAVDNVSAIANTGTAVTNGGIDGSGDAYAAALTGTSITWAGAVFTWGGGGTVDAVSGKTIALPAVNDSAVSVLATGVHGDQLNQVFVVNYTDGTSSSSTQSLSDWYTPQNYTGESQVLAMPYRLTSNGAVDNRAFHLYGYSFAVNSAKTLKSITLPSNRNVVVLAVDVMP